MKILIFNAGSSSQKSCLYDLPDDHLPTNPPEPLWEGTVDWTHHQGIAEIKIKTAKGRHYQAEIPTQLDNLASFQGISSEQPPSWGGCSTGLRQQVIAQLLKTLWTGETKVIDHPSKIDAIGHRVVHGGQEYRQSVPVTPTVKAAIARLAQLAPVHNPANLEGIVAIEQVVGSEVPQFAVFDTAFHSHMPDATAIYPGPYQWVQQGIRRYGFHGISHQYCAQRAADLLGRDLQELRLIICHLGNGCSLSAVDQGHSIDTTMGFTPLDGLMMGSRAGSVDPGILIYLMQQNGYTAEQVDQELNYESGLKGISGISADMRQVLQAIEAGDARAKLALDVYIHRLHACMGSMLISLAGLDALVFTAGVGENSAIVRSRACKAFEFLGLEVDHGKNQAGPVDQDIAMPDSPIRVLVIHTQEDWAIAQECWGLLRPCLEHGT
ncbi:MAG TPA: acetate kinase [Coleofasciculaceae cyanobacterium]